MASMRTNIALSLVSFALAAPMTQPEPEPQGVEGPGAFCFNSLVLITDLIDFESNLHVTAARLSTDVRLDL